MRDVLATRYIPAPDVFEPNDFDQLISYSKAQGRMKAPYGVVVLE